MRLGKDWRKWVGKNYRYVSNGAREMAYKLTVMIREEKENEQMQGSMLGKTCDRGVKEAIQTVIQLYWKSRNAICSGCIYYVLKCKWM